MSENVFFNPIPSYSHRFIPIPIPGPRFSLVLFPFPSHSHWFIPIPIPGPRFSLVLFPFPSHSRWLFPFSPAPIPVLLVVSHQTGKLNNARNSSVINFFESTKSSEIHVQCQRKQCFMDIQSKT